MRRRFGVSSTAVYFAKNSSTLANALEEEPFRHRHRA